MAPLPSGPIVILENGGHTIKCGVLPSSSASSTSSSSASATQPQSYPDPRIIPNACVRPRTAPPAAYTSSPSSRWLIGHEISDALAHDALDYTGMQYRLPFEKGFLTDWDAQKAVWDGLFSVSSSHSSTSSSSNSNTNVKTGPLLPTTGIDTTTSTLLVTEPYFNLPNIQDTYDQIVFEEYEFAACWRGVRYAEDIPNVFVLYWQTANGKLLKSEMIGYNARAAALVPHGDLFTPHSSTFSSTEPNPKPQCVLIVDAGFSYTHVVPMMDGRVIWQAVKRIDAGGKLLTNILKEQLSYRQWNMMSETFIVEEVKERCCFVAGTGSGGADKRNGGEGGGVGMDFGACLERCRADPSPLTNPIVQEYVLPDLAAGRKGYVRTGGQRAVPENGPRGGGLGREEQVLVMGVERFSVPEVLFRPDDIGLQQSGLAPTIAHALSSLPSALQPFAGMFWAHVGLVGGCTKFPGFKRRLEAELRALAPVGVEVGVWGGEGVGVDGKDDPITTAYRAACSFASSSPSVTTASSKSSKTTQKSSSTSASYPTLPSFPAQTLSRSEYLETGGGSAAARKRFLGADWHAAPEENWRRRVDEAMGVYGDDEDQDGCDVDLEEWYEDIHIGAGGARKRRGGSGPGGQGRQSIGRQRQVMDDGIDGEDAEARAFREKEERRKAARRKRDADRKKRLAEEAAAQAQAAAGGGASDSAHDPDDEAGTVTVKARAGPKGKQREKEKDKDDGLGSGKGKAKAATTPAPTPTAPARPRVRSTRAGAADVQMEDVVEVSRPAAAVASPSTATGMGTAAAATAGVDGSPNVAQTTTENAAASDGDVQMGDA